MDLQEEILVEGKRVQEEQERQEPIRKELRKPLDIKRVIPLDEVRASGHYNDMADLAEIFNHEIVEMGDTWRWRPNRLINLIEEFCPVYTPSSAVNHAEGKFGYGRHCTSIRASLDMNNLWTDFYDGLFTAEELMKYYMQTGYSLGGFAEVFGQKEACECKLPGAKTEYEEGQDRDYYVENILEYMCRIHKGEVLKL